MRFFFSTGDISGDAMAALLVEELKSRPGDFSFSAVGGERLREAGAQILESSVSWSAIGVFDALKKVPEIALAYRRLKKSLKKIKPAGAILVDTPAFNIPLARYLHSLHVPVIYFFPPSSWRKDLKRAAGVGRWVEKVIAPFPETAELYAKAGVPTFFSGHPLIDSIPAGMDEKSIFGEFGLDPGRPVIGLFPGSRSQEIRYLLPLQLEAARVLLKKRPELQFALPIAAKKLEQKILKEIRKSGIPVAARTGAGRAVMQIAKSLLLASGTATLEAALFLKPMVIIYKISPLTWKLEKPFLKGVKFAGLPNLLANERIVPELIQGAATVENIVHEMEKLFDPQEEKRMIRDLESIRPQLGKPGVMARVADLILETFRE